MNLQQRLERFRDLPAAERLDSWRELTGISNDFIQRFVKDSELGISIAETIDFHRSLLGSSKAYEDATEIDIELCNLGLRIARLVYGKTSALKKFIVAALYYADFRPDLFNKKELVKELGNLKG
jgi:hypothetical protein